MAIKTVLVLLIALMGQRSAAADENLKKYLDLLKNGTKCEKRSAVLALHQQGKQAIPILLEHTDDDEIARSSTFIFAHRALSSFPPGAEHDQFAGVLYAYVIELILGRTMLSKDEGQRCDFVLGPNDPIYGHGVIFNGGKPIEAADLPRIRQVYSQWWERNRSRSLAKLRQDWKASRRPLARTQYKWL